MSIFEATKVDVMNKFWKNTKTIRVRLLIFFAFFTLTITASHFITRNSFNTSEKYRLILKKAMQNRDLVEEIIIHGEEALDKQPQAQILLVDDIAKFQLNLDLLKKGGIDNIEGEKVILPTCEPVAIPDIERLEKLWDDFKTRAEYLAHQDIIKENEIKTEKQAQNLDFQAAKKTLKYLIDRRQELILLQTQFIQSYQNISKQQQEATDTWLWTLWISNIFLVIIGYSLVRQLVIKPLGYITYIANKIGQGDLTQKINYKRENEVGVVADALNNMVDKIKNATDFIKNIEQGNLLVSYSNTTEIITEKDTLAGALLSMRDRMKNVATEENERNWVIKGEALFGQILQTFNDDTDALSYSIVSNVVKYLEANQGGLFLLNVEQKSLGLIACYAFERRRFLQKEVLVGEGLVGQVAKDADTIYITDIPDNYIDITSGLGGTTPRSVLVVPLKMSDRVYGVLEIASFHSIKRYQIEFLEKLSESIASKLEAVRANEENKKLLERFKSINEQLGKQEQEMRRNMRTLEAIQSEMQKSQESLSSQSYAIKYTLISLELSLDRKILSVNELFLKSTKYEQKEILGHNHKMLVPQNDIDDAEHERLWRDLKTGIPRTGEFRRIDKYGNEIWWKATYSPIKDKHGNPYKVLQLAFDVTEDKRLKSEFKEQLDAFRRSSAMIEYDMNGTILSTNENFLELMRYGKDEILNKSYQILVPKDEQESKTYQFFWQKLKQGSFHVGEVKRINRSGRVVWLQGSFNPILDLNGKPYKVIEFLTDITDRKQAEDKMINAQIELQTKQANLTALINNTDDAIFTINTQYRFLLYNESAKLLFIKLSGGSVRSNNNLLDIIPKSYQQLWKGYLDRALASDKFSIEQSIFSETSGHKSHLSIYFNPIKDEAGRIAGVAIFVRDITQRKERELEFNDFARKQASRTTRMIETQKQQLEAVTKGLEDEIKRLTLKVIEVEKQKEKINQKLNFYNHVDCIALCIDQKMDVVNYNQVAQNWFYKHHYCLQPDYYLPDFFSTRFYNALKDVVRRALNGEEFNTEQIFFDRKDHTPIIFALSFTPMKNEWLQTTHTIIAAKEITPIIKKHRKHVVDKQQKINLSTKKRFVEAEKEWKDKYKSVETIVEKQKAIIDFEQNSQEILLKVDKDGFVINYNQKAENLLAEWYLSLQPDYYFEDIFPNQNLVKWLDYWHKAQDGTPQTWLQPMLTRKHKSIRWFEISFIPQKDEQDKLSHFLIYGYELTNLL